MSTFATVTIYALIVLYCLHKVYNYVHAKRKQERHTGDNLRPQRDLLDWWRSLFLRFRSTIPCLSLKAGSSKLLYTIDEIEDQFPAESWQRIAFEDFRSKILARGTGQKTFPCVYATLGYRSNEHRYCFCETSDPSDRTNVDFISAALTEYLAIAPDLGDNTSLVIVSAPADVRLDVEAFSKRFWRLLERLHSADQKPWPSTVPESIHDANWTFCFEGIPIFPILLTPAHDRRRSRYASVPIVALQPKWILDKLLGTPEKREIAQNKVRKLLVAYDTIEVSPDLAAYGTEGTSEARQLCLLDENAPAEVPKDWKAARSIET